MTYSFKAQLKLGQEAEAFLDGVFSQWYAITPVSDSEQRRGIDRWFDREGKRSAVEYKTDWKAQRTHNAFIETISVDTTGKSGWAYTSQSDWLMYYIPGDELIYILEFTQLRSQLSRWGARYPSKSAQNDGYQTWGLIVPLHELECIARKTLSV